MTIKKARAALSHSVFTGITRKHLDRLVTELAEPFAAAREGRLYRRRGHRDRHRWPGAGHPDTLTLRDRILLTLTWLRLALPHQALAVLYGVDRSTVSAAIRQLLANRGFATPAGPRLHTLADVIAYATAEGLTIRLDGTEIQVRRPPAHRPGRRAFISGKKKQNTIKATVAGLAKAHPHQVITPPLKPKKNAPPDHIAAYNTARKAQSSQRIPAEHAIAAIKW